MTYKGNAGVYQPEEPNLLQNLLITFLLIVIVYCLMQLSIVGWVTDDIALERIRSKYPQGTSVYILSDSGNDIPVIQNIFNVKFEMRVTYSNGHVDLVTWGCTDGLFQNLTCQPYSP